MLDPERIPVQPLWSQRESGYRVAAVRTSMAFLIDHKMLPAPSQHA
jgi:hypothetical protein